MHRILSSQLTRCLSPEGYTEMGALINLVNLMYQEFDKDRARSERANQLMVAELGEINEAREQMLATLQSKNQTLDAALENMAHGLAMFNADATLVVSNSRYRSMFELTCVNAETFAAIHRQIASMCASGTMALDDIPKRMLGRQSVEQCLALADGRTIAVTYQPLAHGGWVEVHRDISEQRRADEQIRFLARHDQLTGLANRVVFNEVIESECARVRRGATIAVMCLDLDRFKYVNDTLGHPVGDKLLQSVAARLKATLRGTDTIARLGGDEFAIVQVQAEQPAGAAHLAQRIIESIGEPFEIDGHQVVIGASVGISVSPDDGTDADSLMRNADLALYRAKSEGRRTYRFFESGMDAVAQERRMLELDLRSALIRDEFDLHFQPLLDLKTNTVTACEALIRWQHPSRGRVAPDQFIPLAEEIGLIIEIGDWVLRRACREACLWPAHIGVAVNVSPAQFKAEGLVQSVQTALTLSGLAADRLEIEITEAVLLQDTEKTLGILERLKAIGVRISMDDFGTGYSSLSYLRKFAFDKLKIDRSFISDINSELNGRSIVKAVTELAASLGMMTTAEGVESEQQRSYLESLNCNEIQGYLISKPLPISDITKLLWQREPISVAA
ncbi:MAG: putative bifunctional diguanylate cyclase/phosphodiesterase [Hyphomicrobiaceae bacterium]